ncbi:MAG: DUF2917 domain-containing protein [Pseudomonadota bacterium]
MLTKTSLELQLTPSTRSLSACWRLMPGRAVSLQPREAGVLHIEQGRAWVTFDGPHSGHGNESGDQFLHAGQELTVRAGQRLVLESWSLVPEMPVCFEWSPAPNVMTVHAARWKTALARRLHEGERFLRTAGRKTSAAA